VVAGDGEPVAGAGDGFNELVAARAGFDFAAEVTDVGVDGALVAVVFVAAGPVDQLVAAVDPAGDAGQGGEQFPFGRGQRGGLPAGGDLAAGFVDDQLPAAVGDRLVLVWDGAGAAQDGAGAQHDLAGAEWLGDVVVGA